MLWTILLLLVSNLFMTFAWYGHLRGKQKSLWGATVTSWGLAFFEYCFQVPGNRIGSHYFSLVQLKIMQECITLLVFSVFAVFAFGEKPGRNQLVSYGLIVAAVYFSFRG